MKLNVTRTSLPPFEEYCEEIRPLWESHWVTNMGEKHDALEAALSERTGCGVTLFANGHLALEAVLQAMELPIGSEVITTPFTFVSTTHAIVRCGLRPVFCDVRPSDGTMDPERIEPLITGRTSAILPVHVYGNVCDVVRIGEIARRHGLKLVYDAAHAFGVRYKGVPVESFGDASMLSFHATKVFSTVEGGAVCWHDVAIEQKLKDLKNFGIRDAEHCEAVGGNAKLDELRAAMGLCSLRHLGEVLAGRRRASMIYRSLLAACDCAPVPLPAVPDADVDPNWSYFPVLFASRGQRDAAHVALAAENINSRKYFWPLTSDILGRAVASVGGHPATSILASLRLSNAGRLSALLSARPEPYVPVARELSERVLCLPLFPELEAADIERICGIICR